MVTYRRKDIVNVELILGILNYKVFISSDGSYQKTQKSKLQKIRKIQKIAQEYSTNDENNPKVEFFLNMVDPKTQIRSNTKGHITKDGFIILKRSRILQREMISIPNSIRKLRQDLGNSGILDKNGILRENILFNSSSAAASFVLGSSAGGPLEWKNKDGISLENCLWLWDCDCGMDKYIEMARHNNILCVQQILM